MLESHNLPCIALCVLACLRSSLAAICVRSVMTAAIPVVDVSANNAAAAVNQALSRAGAFFGALADFEQRSAFCPAQSYAPGAQSASVLADGTLAAPEFLHFAATGHDVCEAVCSQAFDNHSAFYQLPPEAKQKLRVDSRHRGYTAMGQWTTPTGKGPGDRKETFEVCSPCSLSFTHGQRQQPEVGMQVWHPDPPAGSLQAQLPLHGPSQWPEELPGFRATTRQYQEAVADLALR